MNKTTFILFIALIVNSLALADDQPTVSFSPPERTSGNFQTGLIIDNCRNIAINSDLSLPYRQILLEIPSDFNLADFSYQIETETIMADFTDELSYADQPTASEPDLYPHILSNEQQLGLGQKPVVLNQIIEQNNRRYLSLLLFPITYSDEKGWIFTKGIILKLHERAIATSELKSFDDLSYEQKLTDRNFSASDNPEYLIVTSESLSFEQLLNYKKSLGVKAVIKTIESIEADQSGVDSAEKLRNYLKQFHADGGRYVLLGGDETVLPIRYAFAGISYSTPDIADLQICDLYFADLTGNWDVNGNGIYGERYLDSADFIPELIVGRLPFHTQTQIDNYTNKLIQYQTNNLNHNGEYLERAFFLTADQMRDFGDYGQHHEVSQVFPGNFIVDTISGVEQTSGDDPTPTNLSARELEEVISGGYGIVNILNHGSYHGFAVRSSGYNEFPKSSFSTTPDGETAGSFENFEPNNNISFYYSLACDNGAFDKDGAPFNYAGSNMVETLLGLQSAGAVGFVANSRWGWVNSSHYLMAEFYQNLFDHPEMTAAEALTATKLAYSYLRDQVYGLNYFGDPMLKIHTTSPRSISTDIRMEMDQIAISSESDHNPVSDCRVILSDSLGLLQTELTDGEGQAIFNLNLDLDTRYLVSVIKDGYYTVTKEIIPSIATDVDDDLNEGLPTSFALSQNFPNPFNPTTHINFELPRSSDVQLEIYNVIGQKVTTLADGNYPAGVHTLLWDGRNNSGEKVTSGIYFYRLVAGDFKATKKMLLLK